MITEPLSGFGIDVRFDEGYPVVRVTGEVDLCTAPELDALVGALVSRSHGDIVLDVRDVQFMDARGLAVIVRTATTLRLVGSRLIVRAPSGMLQRVFGLANVGDTVRIVSADPDDDHASAIARAARVAADRDLVRAALLVVVALAKATVVGADAVTVSLAPSGSLDSVVAVDQTIAALDRDQYALGEGPCRAAGEEAVPFHLADTAVDRRWPAFASVARAQGVSSILSTPLRASTRAVGALNMYSFRAHAFSDSDIETAELLASGAADIFDRCGSDATPGTSASRVRDAIAARDTIALAQGVLIAGKRLSADDAHATLRRDSHRTSQPLRDVAAAVVAAAKGGASHDPLLP